MSSPQTTGVRCPQCRQPIQASIFSIVDVGKQPQLKNALLRGQINAIACPHCGYRGMLGTPMLYHDPAKQLALVFLPMELGLKRDDEERQIGKLTNQLMDSLPPEQRKMYMLQPKRMISWQSLTEEILQADGITKEMLDKQAAQVRLLDTLLRGAGGEKDFKRIVEAHQSEIDQEFIEFIGTLAQSTAAGGDQQSASQLLQVAVALAQEAGLKPPTAAGVVSAEELLDELREAKDDDELREMVAAIRPALDYKFYQALSDKIEKAPAEEAAALKQLRAKLLSVSDELDRETQAALQNASQLLQQILRSSDIRKAIAENIERIDDAFLMVLQANIQQAVQQKQDQIAQVLQDIYQTVLAQLEAKMPPRMRLINNLLRTDPAERLVTLRERRDELTSEFFQELARLENDLAAQGRVEVAAEVGMLMDQAQEVVAPIEESLPPDLQFVGALIRGTPGERAELLRGMASELTPARLEQMIRLVGQLEAQGRVYLAHELGVVINQAKAWASPIAAA